MCNQESIKNNKVNNKVTKASFLSRKQLRNQQKELYQS